MKYAVIIALVFLVSAIGIGLHTLQADAAVVKHASDFAGIKTITKVIDGDTVVAEGESIRLIGIDTDERGYPCYTEAKKRMEELVLNKEVILEQDSDDKDQYDRYLRYIFIGEQNINLQMVREGLAVARFYPENVRYKNEIVQAESAARSAKIGCKWSQNVTG
jgi:micrococcal nuclease